MYESSYRVRPASVDYFVRSTRVTLAEVRRVRSLHARVKFLFVHGSLDISFCCDLYIHAYIHYIFVIFLCLIRRYLCMFLPATLVSLPNKHQLLAFTYLCQNSELNRLVRECSPCKFVVNHHIHPRWNFP